MLDFMSVATRSTKKDGRAVIEVRPEFLIIKSKDLMIKGGDFYAVFNEQTGLWSTDEDVLIKLVDAEVMEVYNQVKEEHPYDRVVPALMRYADSGSIDRWHKYVQKQSRDNFKMLDDELCFSNTELKREIYASKQLNYPLEEGKCEAWDTIMSTLYSPEERRKIEWAIGSVVNGDSKRIQKFMVFYGAPGTGKSTVLNIVDDLFHGYTAPFESKTLGSANAQFALEPFKDNPLVGIQHDGDLSKIEDNTRINSLVAHEVMSVNTKYGRMYATTFRTFLFMGTNKPVRISDSRSGLLRRLIDVTPTGNKLSYKEYTRLMKLIPFELGHIAWHCKEVYESDPEFYDDYVPTRMMSASNDFYNFMVDAYDTFRKNDSVTLKAAWEMYKTWSDAAKVPYPMSLRTFKEELSNYFAEYYDRWFDEETGERQRSIFLTFKKNRFQGFDDDEEEAVRTTSPAKIETWIKFQDQPSLLDDILCDCPAQYANDEGIPRFKWDNVKKKLSELDTSLLHYVKISPENHIVIDFDIPDDEGNKSFEKNLEEASKWPPTYAELSKSGAGIHLHYIYTGDVTKLERLYKDHIEIKVFTGNSSLRRKLTKCTNDPIATISSGLPLKGEKAKPMVNLDIVQSEKGMRTTIKKALEKRIHGDTTSNVSMILKVLDDAYNSGMSYDVSDLYGAVIAFAANSTNQADKCIKMVSKMHFKSEEPSENHDNDEAPIVFYDCEVFPNLFLICWKFQGKDKPVTRMINPTARQIEGLLKYRLIGFNNRDYDNHLLYGRLIGYDNEQIYKLSQGLVSKEGNKYKFREAYNMSYTDVFDFSSKKQSLKKFEIELGIHHQELGLPWDEPVPEELWEKVAKYCDNDVLATEAVFEARQGDFRARQILADLAGGTVNDTTNSLAIKFIFGNERKPQLVYTDLATGEQSYGR